jgi:hypothetical protein
VSISYSLRVMLNFHNVMISVLFNCLGMWNLHILLFQLMNLIIKELGVTSANGPGSDVCLSQKY